MTDVVLRLAGEEVRLLPERALFWPRTATLVVADLHWGKGADLSRRGHSDPRRLDQRRSDRAGRGPAPHRGDRLVVLGDLFHARAGRIATRTLAELAPVARPRAGLEIMLVRGNHDRHAGDPPDDLRINCVNAPAFVPPFVLRHEPAARPAATPWRGTSIRAWCCAAARFSASACPVSSWAIGWRCCPRSEALPVWASSSRDPAIALSSSAATR